MRRIVKGLSFFVLSCAAFGATAEESNEWSGFPPIFDCFFETDDNSFSARGLAGIGEIYTDSDRSAVRVSPLFWTGKAPERQAADFIWPLGTYRKSNLNESLRLILYTQEINPYGNGYDRFGWIPVGFYGHTRDSTVYGGLFPLAGDLRDGLGYDRIRFVLFPLWLRTEQEKIRDESILWPILNWEKGGRLDKFRVFPFYGYNQVEGESLGRFVLFPLWTQSQSLNSEKPASGWMAWPLAGISRRPGEHAFSTLWPLFTYQTRESDSSKVFDRGGIKIHAPWPLFQYSRGISQPPAIPVFNAETLLDRDQNEMRAEDMKLTVWPFFGCFKRLRSDGGFALWPLLWHYNHRSESRIVRQNAFLPLYWEKKFLPHAASEKESVYRHFWPLASWISTGKQTELRILALWPEASNAVIDRNYSPLWTLCRWRSGKENGLFDLFWGMVSRIDNGSFSKTRLFPFYSTENDLKAETECQSFALGIFYTKNSPKEKVRKLLWFIDL